MRAAWTAGFPAVMVVACSFSTDVEFGNVHNTPTTNDELVAPARSQSGALVADCTQQGPEVSTALYGTAFADAPVDLGATAHRWGGNSTTRYNFELGNTWNTAQDWYWQNQTIDPWQTFVGKAAEKGGYAAITVPMLGWVAKDTESYSFSIAQLGQQWAHDPQAEKSDRGNGIDENGTPIAPPPPETTSVKITPAQVGAWVRAIKAHGGPVRMYILDNEPGLWHTTHRDVHPEPVDYDELLEKTIAYATAIREADPDAVIAGPAAHGWWELFYSAKDHEAGFAARPDRLAHGDVPLLEWYLRELRAHETRTGMRLLDVLDVHFYPQADGVQGNRGAGEGTDAATNDRRVRAVRALWDPTYTDESWIADQVQLVPRMKKLIADTYPGLKLSLGEYNFGGEKHLSGAVALAEGLGRMAQGGVDFAYYWMAPPEGSAAYAAFRAYANYDGAGARFEGRIVPVTTHDSVSVFAARKGSKLVLVYVNRSGERTQDETVDVGSCGVVRGARSFGIVRADGGLVSADVRTARKDAQIHVTMPPFSVTTVEADLAP